VVVEHRSVEIQQALLVDEDLGAFRPLEDFVPQTRLPLPRERVAQPRTPAALDANAQAAIVDALLGHQRADLASRAFADLNHRWLSATSYQLSAIGSALDLSRELKASS